MNNLCAFVLSTLLLVAISPAQTSTDSAKTPTSAQQSPDKDVVAVQTVLDQVREALVRVQKDLKGK